MRVFVLACLLLVSAQDPDIEALLNSLSDESIEVREKAVTALIGLGVKAEEKVKARMIAAAGEVRARCELILARIARQKRVDAALPPLKRVTIHAKDRRLKEVLQEIHAQTGWPLEFAELDDISVTVRVKDGTPFEAITAVCKSAGLGYVISTVSPKATKAAPPGTEPAIWFKPEGYAEAPRHFAGHFVVEMIAVHLTRRTRFAAPERSAHMSMQLAWPPGVMPDAALLDISSIVDDKGRSLYQRPTYASYGQSDPGFPGRIPTATLASADFKHPEDDAATVSVKGSAILVFAGEDRYLAFEAKEEAYGKPKEMAEMVAELRGIKDENGVTTVTIAYKGQPKSPLPGMIRYRGTLSTRLFQVRLEDGTTAVSNHTGQRHEASFSVMELNFQNLASKITAVEVLAETVYHEERFDFEFRDIPLPK